MSQLAVQIEDRLHSAGFSTQRNGGEVQVLDPAFRAVGAGLILDSYRLVEVRSLSAAWAFIEERDVCHPDGGQAFFLDFAQDRYIDPVSSRLVLALPITPYRPEAMRVTERRGKDSAWFEVETFSPANRRWVEQKTHGAEAEAVADALGWYPAPGNSHSMPEAVKKLNPKPCSGMGM